jgi:hypothetical protein
MPDPARPARSGGHVIDTAELDRLVDDARDADGHDRITYRDPIAAYGADGIAAVERWIADPRLGAFAVRVIEHAGERARPEAIAALRRRRGKAGSEAIAQDVREALARLARPRETR